MLAGALVPGAKGGGAHPGNGDCILLDGRAGLVAIADGSERSPHASRLLLRGVAERITACGYAPGRDAEGALVAAVNDVLSAFHYEDRSTFICLLPLGGGELAYVCGGDSLLLLLDPPAGRVRFRLRANMGFAGRSREVIDSGRLLPRRGNLVLLASDGMWDLEHRDPQELLASLNRRLTEVPMHRLPDELIRTRHPSCRNGGSAAPHDDFGLVLVDPFRIDRLQARLLLGGTTPDTERAYRALLEGGTLADRYEPLPDTQEGVRVLPDSLPVYTPF